MVPNVKTVAAMQETRRRKLPRFKDVDALMENLPVSRTRQETRS
jgi:hypothetical protein